MEETETDLTKSVPKGTALSGGKYLEAQIQNYFDFQIIILQIFNDRELARRLAGGTEAIIRLGQKPGDARRIAALRDPDVVCAAINAVS